MIRDKDLLKRQIIGEKRHQFIYLYDDENRESFLNSIKEDYKISPDNDGPIAIVVENFGLPKTKMQNINVDDKRTAQMAKEYLSLVIVEEIMKQILDNYTEDNRESIVWGTIRWLNRVDKNPRKPYTTTEEESFNMFKEGKSMSYAIINIVLALIGIFIAGAACGMAALGSDLVAVIKYFQERKNENKSILTVILGVLGAIIGFADFVIVIFASFI